MKITWEIHDGYIAGNRTYETYIPDDELDMCETEEEKEELISEYIQSDFEQRVTWSIK